MPDLRARTDEDAVVGVRAREEAVSVMERVAVVGSEADTDVLGEGSNVDQDLTLEPGGREHEAPPAWLPRFAVALFRTTFPPTVARLDAKW